MALKKAPVSAELVKDFRERNHLRLSDVDSLLGFTSGGKTCARWESEGAPQYVGVMLAYIDQHGLEIAERLWAQRALTA